MKEMILEALKELNIEVYSVAEKRTESAELFFIKRRLDMRRCKDTVVYTVNVFRDFEEQGKPMRGNSQAFISPGMDKAEVLKRIGDAYFASSFVKNPAYSLLSGVKEERKLMPSTLKDRPLTEDALLLAEALFSAEEGSGAFINSAEIFAEKTDFSVLNSGGVDVGYTRYEAKGEFVVQCKEPQDVEQYFSFGYGDLNTEALQSKARAALKTVQDRARAKESPKGGAYDLVLSGEHLETLLSYYFARSSASMIYAKYSNWQVGTRVQGEKVEGEKLNITALPSAPYSQEGIPMRERPLVQNGELQLIHGGQRFSEYLGVKATGDYERASLGNGVAPFEEMKAGCLYPVSFSDFQMDDLSGRFGGEIRLAYLFTPNGVKLLTGGSINGSLLEKQGDLAFSLEKYEDLNYSGPFAVKIKGVNVSGV